MGFNWDGALRGLVSFSAGAASAAGKTKRNIELYKFQREKFEEKKQQHAERMLQFKAQYDQAERQLKQSALIAQAKGDQRAKENLQRDVLNVKLAKNRFDWEKNNAQVDLLKHQVEMDVAIGRVSQSRSQSSGGGYGGYGGGVGGGMTGYGAQSNLTRPIGGNPVMRYSYKKHQSILTNGREIISDMSDSINKGLNQSANKYNELNSQNINDMVNDLNWLVPQLRAPLASAGDSPTAVYYSHGSMANLLVNPIPLQLKFGQKFDNALDEAGELDAEELDEKHNRYYAEVKKLANSTDLMNDGITPLTSKYTNALTNMNITPLIGRHVDSLQNQIRTMNIGGTPVQGVMIDGIPHTSEELYQHKAYNSMYNMNSQQALDALAGTVRFDEEKGEPVLLADGALQKKQDEKREIEEREKLYIESIDNILTDKERLLSIVKNARDVSSKTSVRYDLDEYVANMFSTKRPAVPKDGIVSEETESTLSSERAAEMIDNLSPEVVEQFEKRLKQIQASGDDPGVATAELRTALEMVKKDIQGRSNRKLGVIHGHLNSINGYIKMIEDFHPVLFQARSGVGLSRGEMESFSRNNAKIDKFYEAAHDKLKSAQQRDIALSLDDYKVDYPHYEAREFELPDRIQDTLDDPYERDFSKGVNESLWWK